VRSSNCLVFKWVIYIEWRGVVWVPEGRMPVEEPSRTEDEIRPAEGAGEESCTLSDLYITHTVRHPTPLLSRQRLKDQKGCQKATWSYNRAGFENDVKKYRFDMQTIVIFMEDIMGTLGSFLSDEQCGITAQKDTGKKTSPALIMLIEQFYAWLWAILLGLALFQSSDIQKRAEHWTSNAQFSHLNTPTDAACCQAECCYTQNPPYCIHWNLT
jgi:hypothetical protein